MKKCRGQRGKQKLTLEQKEKVSNSENFYFKFQGRFYFAEFSKIKDTFLRFKECVFCNSNHYSTGKFPFLVHLMNHFDQDQELLIDYSEDSVISVYTDSTDRTIKLSELNLNDLDNLISEISAANTLNSLRNNLLNEQAHQYVERFSDVSIVYDHADVLCPVIKGLKDDHFQPFDELVTFLHANKLDKYGIVLLDLELVSSLPEFTSKQLGDKLGGFDVRTQSIKATKSMGCHLIESKPSPRKSTLSNYCKLIQPYSPINEVHLLRDTSEIDFESLSQKSKHRQSKQREIGIYATNIDKSIINDSSDLFKTIINKQLVDLDLPSVSNPYGYLASYRTLFGLHIEDCGLYSFNLNISNGTKIWFGVPNNQYSACLELLRELYPNEFTKCKQFFTHKTIFVNPQVLKERGIKSYKTVQTKKTAVLTFPFAFHEGENENLVYSEAINFYTPHWLEVWNKQSDEDRKHCTCGYFFNKKGQNTAVTVDHFETILYS